MLLHGQGPYALGSRFPVACGVLGIDAIDFGVVRGGEREQGRDRDKENK